jgi:hypothetical protein
LLRRERAQADPVGDLLDGRWSGLAKERDHLLSFLCALRLAFFRTATAADAGLAELTPSGNRLQALKPRQRSRSPAQLPSMVVLLIVPRPTVRAKLSMSRFERPRM